ncbi:MAG: hydratase [Pseudomonadota bacterium]|nr:hydratase [Pseudomonadota bacterium]
MSTTPQEELAIAEHLIAAYDASIMLAPISQHTPQFDIPGAYRVLGLIENHRIDRGWKPVGRKIGFTNTTLWPRYGVFQPMWARVWSHTVHVADGNTASLGMSSFVQPRIEPEVVFGLAETPPLTDDPRALLESVAWIAPGFEIVQSHYPDWKFTAADCTAAFGLHGALVVGERIALSAGDRDAISRRLPTFALSLRKNGEVIDRGTGANVLGGPAHALLHLVRLLAADPAAPPLSAGELVSTGTITDAWPIAAGETWTSDYGELPLPGLRLSVH